MLAACADSDWRMSVGGGEPAPAGTLSLTGPHASADRNCDHIAAQRSYDVAGQGFDESVQHKVYEDTYVNCVNWTTGRAP